MVSRLEITYPRLAALIQRHYTIQHGCMADRSHTTVLYESQKVEMFVAKFRKFSYVNLTHFHAI